MDARRLEQVLRERLRAAEDAEASARDLAQGVLRARHDVRELERTRELAEVARRARAWRPRDDTPIVLEGIDRDAMRRLEETQAGIRRAERELEDWRQRESRAASRLARLRDSLARLGRE